MIEQLADGITLYLGDCREILPKLDKFDAVVTDPPYGVNKAEWDSAYPAWLEELAFYCADTVCIMPGMWALPTCVAGMGERYRAVIAGVNLNGMTFGPIGFSNWIPVVVGGYVPHRGQDTILFSVGAEPKPDHASPKPLEFMKRLVARVTEDNSSILDPFMGAGTTGVAAIKLGRKFTGIEIDPTYFGIACRRISAALKQPDLFIDWLPNMRIAPPEQAEWHQMWATPFDLTASERKEAAE